MEMTISNPAATHRPEAPPACTVTNTDMSRIRSRRVTKTESSFKTSEFAVFVIAVIGVLLASYLVTATDGRADNFMPDRAWFYIVLLSIGYMVSRGLAKCGSRHRDDV
jgi:hypothetical protein